jgi:hypothetical protein
MSKLLLLTIPEDVAVDQTSKEKDKGKEQEKDFSLSTYLREWSCQHSKSKSIPSGIVHGGKAYLNRVTDSKTRGNFTMSTKKDQDTNNFGPNQEIHRCDITGCKNQTQTQNHRVCSHMYLDSDKKEWVSYDHPLVIDPVVHWVCKHHNNELNQLKSICCFLQLYDPELSSRT